jgi:excisionase family DNA binding protein
MTMLSRTRTGATDSESPPGKRRTGGGAETAPRGPLVDTPTAAQYLGRKESWLYDRWRELGIPCYKVGNGLRWRLADLDEWLEGQRANGATAA